MIVKNEEKVLSRVLECAKQFCDEIIIVDTGSTDKTKQIAHHYTNKIFDFVWIDDFAKARNFAYSKATCDYQLWLDADDFLEENSIKKIIELKSSNTKNSIDVYMFKYKFGELEYYRERLTKRSCNFQWQGFVHEVITPSGQIKYCNDIVVKHLKISQPNPKRNLILYRKAIRRGEPLSPRDLYYYSRELYYNGFVNKAKTTLKKFLKIPNTFAPDNLGAHLLLSECFNDTTYSLKILFDALKIHVPTPELCCKIAYYFEKQNAIKNSIFWFKSAINCPPQQFGFINKDYSNTIPYIELSRLFYNIGNKIEAKKYHDLAKQTAPHHKSVIFNEKFFV